MAFCTGSATLRKGLVVLALLLAAPFVFPQAGPDVPRNATGRIESSRLEPQLKEIDEIESSDCRLGHRNPLNLLFLLPGALFFLLAVLSRRYRRLLPFFALFLLLALSDAPPPVHLVQAREAFTEGRYADALLHYESAAENRPCNPALLYNLGVVCHYLGQPGPALHYLRRSLRLAPADTRVRSVTRDLQDDYGLSGQVTLPFPVHADVAYALVLMFANTALILGAFSLRTHKIQFLIALVLVTILLLGSMAFFAGRLASGQRRVAVVISPQGQLLRVPEEDSRSWFALPEGTSLWIRGRSGGYYLVETSSQIDGWVREDTVLVD